MIGRMNTVMGVVLAPVIAPPTGATAAAHFALLVPGLVRVVH
jgi:hypothetical protein